MAFAHVALGFLRHLTDQPVEVLASKNVAERSGRIVAMSAGIWCVATSGSSPLRAQVHASTRHDTVRHRRDGGAFPSAHWC